VDAGPGAAPAANEPAGVADDDPAPGADDPAPGADDTAPVADDPAPGADDPAPGAEDTAPVADDTAPGADELAGVADEADAVATDDRAAVADELAGGSGAPGAATELLLADIAKIGRAATAPRSSFGRPDFDGPAVIFARSKIGGALRSSSSRSTSSWLRMTMFRVGSMTPCEGRCGPSMMPLVDAF